MNKISLVVATIGRDKEIERLLNSLSKQTRPVDEIIIVDQNKDDRVRRILVKYSQLPIVYVASKPVGANAARNLGLCSVSGDIVGFPDDDCWFPSEVLAQVDQVFDQYELEALSGRLLTASGTVSSGRWQLASGLITHNNVWTTTIESASFFTTNIIKLAGGFDELLGPGAQSIYGAHEIDDLFIRILKLTSRARYEPTIRIGHDEPVSSYDLSTLNRAFRYGAGLGYVLKKHQYPFLLLLRFLTRSVGGAIVSLLQRDAGRARFYLSVFLGRIFGWIFAEKQSSKQKTPV